MQLRVIIAGPEALVAWLPARILTLFPKRLRNYFHLLSDFQSICVTN